MKPRGLKVTHRAARNSESPPEGLEPASLRNRQ